MAVSMGSTSERSRTRAGHDRMNLDWSRVPPGTRVRHEMEVPALTMIASMMLCSGKEGFVAILMR